MTMGNAGEAVAGYAGDVTPDAAWEALRSQPDAVLVDVRSDAEWAFVGLPDLSSAGKDVVRAAWATFPGMKPNPAFAQTVADQGVGPDKAVYLLCRSGVRSAAAARALTALGYARCYNIAGGFEGDLDAGRHRGQVNGWKLAGLPWSQS